MFFDDNANDLVKPNGELEDVNKLIKLGNIVAVNPQEAILNPDSFIEKIKTKLK